MRHCHTASTAATRTVVGGVPGGRVFLSTVAAICRWSFSVRISDARAIWRSAVARVSMAEQNNNRCARTVKTDTSTHAGHTTHSELSESNDPADSLALMLPIAATGMHTATHTEVGVPKSTCESCAQNSAEKSNPGENKCCPVTWHQEPDDCLSSPKCDSGVRGA